MSPGGKLYGFCSVDGTSTIWFIVDLRSTITLRLYLLEWYFRTGIQTGGLNPAVGYCCPHNWTAGFKPPVWIPLFCVRFSFETRNFLIGVDYLSTSRRHYKTHYIISLGGQSNIRPSGKIWAIFTQQWFRPSVSFEFSGFFLISSGWSPRISKKPLESKNHLVSKSQRVKKAHIVPLGRNSYWWRSWLPFY